MATHIWRIVGSSKANTGGFYEAGLGKLDCSESNGEGISRELECKTAALKLKLVYKGKGDKLTIPKGCSVWNNQHVYWKTGFTIGATDPLSSPICKIRGNHNL